MRSGLGILLLLVGAAGCSDESASSSSGGAAGSPARDAGSGGSVGGTSGQSTGGAAATMTGGTSGAAGGSGAGGSGNTGPSDFPTRCQAPGVVRCVGFDSAQEIAGKSGDPTGTIPGAAAPALDTAIKASGNSSLKFTIPPNSPADTSGSYWANFSD